MTPAIKGGAPLLTVRSVGGGGGRCNGTQTPPTRGATTGSGYVLQMGFDVDEATGLVSCVVRRTRTTGS